jgi:hypothetical protein
MSSSRPNWNRNRIRRKSVYADPIRADGEYTVSVGVASHSEMAPVSGGRSREVGVEVLAADRVRISPVRTGYPRGD